MVSPAGTGVAAGAWLKRSVVFNRVEPTQGGLFQYPRMRSAVVEAKGAEYLFVNGDAEVPLLSTYHLGTSINLLRTPIAALERCSNPRLSP